MEAAGRIELALVGIALRRLTNRQSGLVLGVSLELTQSHRYERWALPTKLSQLSPCIIMSWSGWWASLPRPLGPRPSALTGLRYTPTCTILEGTNYKASPQCLSYWYRKVDLNHRHTDYDSAVLPTELFRL